MAPAETNASATTMNYDINDERDATTVEEAVRAGIRTSDPTEVGRRDYQSLCFSLRDDHSAIVGGIYGATMWGWLMINGLWVHQDLRGRGLGTRLLLHCEEVAISRGCRGAWLGTFDFQARGFYERHGYVVFAALSDFPTGHTHYSR